jgi:molecular chaperone GrpE
MEANSKRQPGPDSDLDVEHELPPADSDESAAAENQTAGSEASTGTAVVAEEISRLRAELDQLNDRFLRSLADADNARKRAQRDAAEQRTYGVVEAVRAFLPLLDGLERALQTPSSSAQDLLKGIQLLQKQTLDALRRLGVEPIQATGERFDPHWHEAVESVDNPAVADQTVLDELQRGYRLKDRLVRPAMVRVARSSKH